MRVPFDKLFSLDDNGIIPRVPLQIGVYVLSPNADGVQPKHVNLNQYTGMDVEVVHDRVTGRQVIQGFYGEPVSKTPPVEYPGRFHPLVPNKQGRFLRRVADAFTSLVF